MIKFKCFLPVVVSLSMIACNQPLLPKPDDPSFAPIIPDSYTQASASSGSLYIDGVGLSLYQDIKAYKVGDILTVKLIEKTTASKDANTKFSRDYEANLANPTILGNNPKFKLSQLLPFARPKANAKLENDIRNDSEFKGSGDSSQKNSLAGDIAVTVAQVLPNKNLLVKGEKWLTLNQGSEYIRLSGIIRPSDVSTDNVVLSTKIADARISYSGTGAVADSSRAGWMARFFNSFLWPF